MKEWTEEKLDQELKKMMENIPEQTEIERELEKKIEIRIRKKIQKIVYRTISWLIGIALITILLINPLLNAAFFNPEKWNWVGEEDGQGQTYETLKDYFEVTRPYAELCTLEVKAKNFARYELQMQITDRRSYVSLGTPNVWVDVNFGEYKNWKDSDRATLFLANRFDNPWENREETLESIKELPASAVLYLSIAEEDPRTVEGLLNETVGVSWIEVYQPEVEFQGGIALKNSVIAGGEKARDEMSADQLKEEYVSNLQDLIEHQEIWKSMGLCSSSGVFSKESQERVLKACYENAKEINTLQTRNYCIYGKRDEILKYLEQREINSLLVDDILLSELSYRE